jgi:hypothetical protein
MLGGLCLSGGLTLFLGLEYVGGLCLSARITLLLGHEYVWWS